MSIVRDEFRSAVKRLGSDYGRWIESAVALPYRLHQEVTARMWRAHCRRCDLAFEGYRDSPLVGDVVETRRVENDDDADGVARITASGTAGKIVEIQRPAGIADPMAFRIYVDYENGASLVYSLDELCDPETCHWQPAEPEPWYAKALKVARFAEAFGGAREWADYKAGIDRRREPTEECVRLQQWLLLLLHCKWVGMVEDFAAADPETAPLVAEWAFTQNTDVAELAKVLPADTKVRMADGSVK